MSDPDPGGWVGARPIFRQVIRSAVTKPAVVGRSRIVVLVVALLVVGTGVVPSHAHTNGAPDSFTNPIITTPAADPFITVHDGEYLMTYTTGDRLVLRRATSIADLAHVAPQVIWNPRAVAEPADRAFHLWAPELHRLRSPEDGDHHWYFYYSAGSESPESVKGLHVLESVGDDPSGPYRYKGALGVGYSIDPTVHTRPTRAPNPESCRRGGCSRGGGRAANVESFLFWSSHRVGAPDGSVLAEEGVGQSLWVARLRNPWTVEGDGVQISQATYPWEMATGPVNEGPSVIEHADELHVVYSASGCTSDLYNLGRLTVDRGADLLDPLTWVAAKHPTPVFLMSHRNGVYGVGHNGFFRSPDGTEEWLVYHAHDNPGAPLRGGGGCGGVRTVRAQEFTWNADGTPDLGEPVALSESQPLPSGDPGPSGDHGDGATPSPPPGLNPPHGAIDGVICEAVATPVAPGSCRFHTKNPPGAVTQGFVSQTTGSFTIANIGAGCRIQVPLASQVITGSGHLTSDPGTGRWAYTASGAGIGSLTFDDDCTYELTVHADGAGGVLAGQTN